MTTNFTSFFAQYDKFPIVIFIILLLFTGLWIFLKTISNQLKKAERSEAEKDLK